MSGLAVEIEKGASGAETVQSATVRRTTTFAGFLLAAIIGVLNTTPTFSSDSGAYLSVEQLMLRGYALYSEVFDNKDPLFYYVNAIFLQVLGHRGPAVAEAALLGLAGSAAAWYVVRRGSGWALALAAAVVVPIALTSGPMIPGLTHTWGMVALFLAILAMRDSGWILAGSIATLAAFLELRTFPIALAAVLVTVVVTEAPRRSWYRFAVGVFSTGSVSVGIMLMRGELVGYLKIQLYNIKHVAMVRELQGTGGSIPSVVRGSFSAMNTYASAEFMMVVIVMAVAMSAIVGRHRVIRTCRQLDAVSSVRVERLAPREDDAWIVLVVAIATVVVTSMTMLFDHHAQLLDLPLAVGAVLAIVSLDRLANASAQVACLVAILFTAFALGGPWTAADRLDGWKRDPRSPTADALERAVPSGSPSYALVGDVAFERAHAAFLDERFRFSCKLLYQHPWDEQAFDSFVKCLRTDPEIVVVNPLDPVLLRHFQSYRVFQQEIERVLDECFEQVGVATDDRRVFERLKACPSASAARDTPRKGKR